MFDTRNPYISKRQRGVGKKPTLRYLSSLEDTYPMMEIESISTKARTGPTATLGSSHAYCLLFTPNVSKTLNGVAIAVGTSTGPAAPVWEVYATSGGFPTGDPIATTTTAASLGGGNGAFEDAAFAAGVALTAGVQYALVLQSASSTGTSYVLTPGTAHRAKGWGTLFTTSLDATIEDTNWRWRSNWNVAMHLNWSDGTQLCAANCYGADAASVTNQTALYGDPSSASAGRFGGISITPKFDFALTEVEVACRTVFASAAADANGMECRIYRLSSAGVPESLIATSSDDITGVDLITSALIAFRKVRFASPVNLERGKRYGVLFCQTAAGGSSDSSNYMVLQGATGGTYATNAFPPELPGENLNHGILPVSTTTGIEDLAVVTNHIPYVNLYGIPYVR